MNNYNIYVPKFPNKKTKFKNRRLRFLERYDAAIELYIILMNMNLDNLDKEKVIILADGKFEVSFSNADEAKKVFHDFIDEALKFHEDANHVNVSGHKKRHKEILIKLRSML